MKRQRIAVSVLIVVFLLNPVAGLGSRLNIIPGGVQVAHAQEQLDLVITDAWSEGTNICYQIRNIGSGPIPAGHETLLTVEGVPQSGDWVDVALAAGERLNRCFLNVVWQCSAPEDTVKVNADNQNHVTEDDETNNETEELWPCDTTAPQITSGPTASQIGPTTATVSWITDEDSDSLVQCGRTAGAYEDQVSSANLTQNHQIVLNDLDPASTYHCAVRSEDATGNAVTSGKVFFATEPAPDGLAPTISNLTVTKGEGDFAYYAIAAEVSDNAGVERVEFYMDDELLGIDYAPPALPASSFSVSAADITTDDFSLEFTPYAMGMTREEFFSEHTVKAIAFDRSGLNDTRPGTFNPPYECADIVTRFRFPHSDYTLYTDGETVPAGTSVPIEVYASYSELECRGVYLPGSPWPYSMICERVQHKVSSVDFYVNTVHKCTRTPPADPSFDHTYTCDWDVGGLHTGDFAIRVDTTLSEDCKQTITRDVRIATGEPQFNVQREVTRVDNYFQVQLTIENEGTATFQLDEIEDHTAGFQPLVTDTGTYSVTSDCWPYGLDCDVRIDVSAAGGGDLVSLGPGDVLTVDYMAVPILYPALDAFEYGIGEEDVRLVDGSGAATERFDRPCTLTTDGETLAEAVDSAKRLSDYLIVAKPQHFFVPGDSHDDGNTLLAKLAELGQLKRGVLGYLSSTDRETRWAYLEPESVKDLIRAWGSDMMGSDGVAGNYLSNGYLLLVGELGGIPTWTKSSSGIQEATEGFPDGPIDPVHWVDNVYADMSGDDHRPELIVGRIIGDDFTWWLPPVETALLDQDWRTDASDALIVSGVGEGEAEFEANADDIADLLDDEFTVAQIYGSDYFTESSRRNAVKHQSWDKDVVFYRDHGDKDCWSHTLCENNFPVDFGTSHPFVFGMACLTGEFEDWSSSSPYGDGDGIGLAEAFLRSGAGVYIGATELSPTGPNNEAGEFFFDEWVNSTESIGKVFKATKREMRRAGGNLRLLWIWEYNLYGDPKYGGLYLPPSSITSASSVAMPQTLAPPPTSIQVTVPDYSVTTRDDLDYVEMTDGQILLEPGQPRVPLYVVSADYAPGYQVQDVVMTQKAGLTATTGLNLPTVSEAQAVDSNQRVATTAGLTNSGWYPEEEYRWEVVENADGSTTLNIVLFPFYYNPATTNAEFYKDYGFDIDYISSTVEIEVLHTAQDAYAQGNDVEVDLWLNNSGAAQDVIVDAVIKTEGTGEVVGGLLLRTLNDLTGLATFSAQWDSSGSEPGYYLVEVEIRNTDGQVLDRERKLFRLGISFGEIVTFTATPSFFDIGDAIDISLVFSNTGTLPITGTAVIQVKDGEGETVQEFNHTIANLVANDSLRFNDQWDTTGTEEGWYNIVGQVLYDAKATEPEVSTISTYVRIYLPVTQKSEP